MQRFGFIRHAPLTTQIRDLDPDSQLPKPIQNTERTHTLIAYREQYFSCGVGNLEQNVYIDFR